MNTRVAFTAAFSVLFLATLLAPAGSAQGRSGGMRAAAGPRMRSSMRRGGEGFAHRSPRRFFNGPAYVFPPYLYAEDDFDYEPEPPPPPSAPQPETQMAQPPAPSARLIEPLILENRNGEWVRVPTSSQLALSDTTKPGTTSTSTMQSGKSGDTATPPSPETPLPPAVIVFRDGHTRDLGKYMIQGDTLYTRSDYWTTGSWSESIPLSQLDLPASLKLNQERGTKFSLPSAPNEVVVRF